jgi:hypothetical protein
MLILFMEIELTNYKSLQNTKNKIKQIDIKYLCIGCKKKNWRDNKNKLCDGCIEKMILQNLYDAGLL